MTFDFCAQGFGAFYAALDDRRQQTSSAVRVLGGQCPECGNSDFHHARCERSYHDLTHPDSAPYSPVVKP